MRGPSLDPLDRLGPARTLQVVALDELDLDAAPVREPHRHDYHELIWLRAGTGEHLVDGEVVPARSGTVTVIGRGQVHVLRRAVGLRGAVVRFSDPLLARGAGRIVTGFALAGAGGPVIAVPPEEADRPSTRSSAPSPRRRRVRPTATPPTSSATSSGCSCCGSSASTTLSRAFKRHTGESPQAHRAEARGGA